MSDYCECPWTGKVFDLVDQLQEAKGRLAAVRALADEAAKYLCGWGTGEPCESHCDCGTAGTVWYETLHRAVTGGVSE